MKDVIAISVFVSMFSITLAYAEGRAAGWQARSVSCDGQPEVVVQEMGKTTCVYPGLKIKEVKL